MKKILISFCLIIVVLISLGVDAPNENGSASRHYNAVDSSMVSCGFFDAIIDTFDYYFYGDDDYYGGYDDGYGGYYDDYHDYDDYYDDYGYDDYYDDYEDFDDYDSYSDYYDEYYDYYDEEVVAVYLVDNGGLELEWGTPSNSEDESYETIWDEAQALIPDDYECMIILFEVATDGSDGTVGYVYNADDSLETWVISLDPSDSINRRGDFESYFYETVIHEFGHILTLNYTQMSNSAKNTYVVEEGVLKAGSYLNLFYQEFWTDMIDEYNQKVDDEDEDDVYDFYLDHMDMFVTDYAATNPGEDIAESFTVFIMEDRPTGTDIKDQKVEFFYQFEELVEMRDEIRNALEY